MIYYLNQAQAASDDHPFTYDDSIVIAIVTAEGYDISHATVIVKDAQGNVVTDLWHSSQNCASWSSSGTTATMASR